MEILNIELKPDMSKISLIAGCMDFKVSLPPVPIILLCIVRNILSPELLMYERPLQSRITSSVKGLL
jgi:hypothetical protein